MRTFFYLVSLFIFAGCAGPRLQNESSNFAQELVPESIRVSGKHAPSVRAFFNGGLIYTCLLKPTAENVLVYDWEETATQGSLTFDNDLGYGRHEGPSYTWRLGTTILQGALIASWSGNSRSDAPWNLYQATAAVGDTSLARALWIQRLETTGGAIPTVACTSAQVGHTHAVSAQAYFIFWQKV